MERMWVRARAICLLAISLALLGMPAAALAARAHHPAPDRRRLWRVYPLGTQRFRDVSGDGARRHRHQEPLRPDRAIGKRRRAPDRPAGDARGGGAALRARGDGPDRCAAPRIAAAASGPRDGQRGSDRTAALGQARTDRRSPRPSHPADPHAGRDDRPLRRRICSRVTAGRASADGGRQGHVPPGTRIRPPTRNASSPRPGGATCSRPHGRHGPGSLTPKALDVMERNGRMRAPSEPLRAAALRKTRKREPYYAPMPVDTGGPTVGRSGQRPRGVLGLPRP